MTNRLGVGNDQDPRGNERHKRQRLRGMRAYLKCSVGLCIVGARLSNGSMIMLNPVT